MDSLWLKDATYIAPAKVISTGIRAATHLAHFSLNGKLATAYVKAFPASEHVCLFNEAVGGAIAKISNIGSPDGGLMCLDVNLLSKIFPSYVFNEINGQVICWVSLPVGDGYGVAEVGLADSVGRVLGEIKKHMLDWSKFANCAAFDTWVANVDRHPNNLLLLKRGELIPIDHSDCFGGHKWGGDNFLDTDRVYVNRMLDEICGPPESLSLPMKAKLIAASETLHSIFLNSENELTGFAACLEQSVAHNWLRWVELRSQLVVEQMRQKVKVVV